MLLCAWDGFCPKFLENSPKTNTLSRRGKSSTAADDPRLKAPARKATLTPEQTPQKVAYSRIFHSEVPIALASWCAGTAQPSGSPLALLGGAAALVGRGKWGCTGPCKTAAAGLSEAGGGGWRGSGGGPGDPASQMGSRWLVLAFPGLRSELLITHDLPPTALGDASMLCGFPFLRWPRCFQNPSLCCRGEEI